MTRLTSILLLTTLIGTLATGCIFEEEETGKNNGWQKPDEQDHKAKIAGKYISGHLGAYDSCPEDGYSSNSSQMNKKPAPGGEDLGASFAPCQEGDENCGTICEPGNPGCGGDWPQSCEQAQMTVELENTGLGDGRGISLQEVQLLDENDRKLASLPWIKVENTSIQKDFDGTLAKNGSKKTLRIRFQGPVDPYQLRREKDLEDQGKPSPSMGNSVDGDDPSVPCATDVSKASSDAPDGGNAIPPCGGPVNRKYFKLRVIFGAEKHVDIKIDSRAVFSQQTVVT